MRRQGYGRQADQKQCKSGEKCCYDWLSSKGHLQFVNVHVTPADSRNPAPATTGNRRWEDGARTKLEYLDSVRAFRGNASAIRMEAADEDVLPL